MKTLAIAMACHLINTAYCQSLSDDNQPSWDDASEAHKQSLMAGVEMHLANPDATPEQSHESWYKTKEAEGWKYGEVKDLEKRNTRVSYPMQNYHQSKKQKITYFAQQSMRLKTCLMKMNSWHSVQRS